MDSSTKGKSVSESNEDDTAGTSENCRGGTNIGTSYFWPRIQRGITEKARFIHDLVEEIISPGARDRRRKEQWTLWVQGGVDNFKHLIEKNDDVLKHHIRLGIPCSFRSYIWSILLGSDLLLLENGGVFQDLICREAECNRACKDTKDIDYTRYKYFKLEYSQRPFREILIAYTLYNKNLKYTQGMGFSAALFLVQLNDPEKAFWAYVAIMEGRSAGRTRMAAFFDELSSPGRPLMVRCTEYLDKMLQISLPDFWSRLEKENLNSSGYAMKWFTTVFSLFPLHFTLRIWDVVLFEGYEIVFYVGLALLKRHKKELLREEVELPNALRDFHLIFPVDADAILEMAWSLQADHPMPSDIKQMILPY